MSRQSVWLMIDPFGVFRYPVSCLDVGVSLRQKRRDGCELAVHGPIHWSESRGRQMNVETSTRSIP
jgi:hypothetical protein